MPQTLDEIRGQVSSPRWRVFEMVDRIVREIESTLKWEKLYDADLPLRDYLSWGLYIEECIPEVAKRIRAALEQPARPGDVPEPQPEELEDHVHWGTKQIEGGMQQVASILSRKMVGHITSGPDATAVIEHKEDLCVPLADVAGKLRSDLRRFASFIVAGESWDASELEVVLFPQKLEELQHGQKLKEHLVETMESFHGSERRMPIAEVIQLWRNGEVLGTEALYELDTLVRGLNNVIEPANRRALYADSYYQMAKWIDHIRACVAGLKQNLGASEEEDYLIREIAAVLDVEMLAAILGEESLRDTQLPRDLPEYLRFLHRGELKKLGPRKSQEQRLLELKATLEEQLLQAGPPVLTRGDAVLLRSTVAALKGKRLVDQLRIRGKLPESLQHLEHIHPLVLSSEDGLKTYLMLLYGQIQNRDLHLLRIDQKQVPMAEKRLAVHELEYHLTRLSSSEAFEAARAMVGSRQPLPEEAWEGLQDFLRHLVNELAPRLQRIGSFDEIQGIPPDCATDLVTACQQLLEMPNPPVEQYETLEGLTDALVTTLFDLHNVEIVVAPPETVEEIEDFLKFMG